MLSAVIVVCSWQPALQSYYIITSHYTQWCT